MSEPKKVTKTSDEEDYLLSYMEENIGLAQMRTIPTPCQPSQSVRNPEDKTNLSGIGEASDVASEKLITDGLTEPAMAGPSSAAPTSPTLRKRKNAQAGKNLKIFSCKKKILKIEKEKLMYAKKRYELQEEFFNSKREYELRLLELRQREVSLLEKKLELKLNKYPS